MTALWRFCKIERKGHFIGSFCQVCGISENVLTEMHNSDKLLLLINKWIFGHFSYRFDGPSKPLLFYFSFLIFMILQQLLREVLWKDHPFLWWISKVRINYYSLTKIWSIEIFRRTWNNGPLNIFKNFYGNAFSLFVFIKRKNHCNVPFNDTYKMCCYHLC